MRRLGVRRRGLQKGSPSRAHPTFLAVRVSGQNLEPPSLRQWGSKERESGQTSSFEAHLRHFSDPLQLQLAEEWRGRV